MTTTLSKARSFKKIMPFAIVAIGLLFVAGMLATTNEASAARPSDYGLTEGDAIRALPAGDIDVYSVNAGGPALDGVYKSFKRLFLSPAIWNFYGDNRWDNIKDVTEVVRDAFPTSSLYKPVSSERVYCMNATGEDTGELLWVNMTPEQVIAEDPDFFLKYFIINDGELGFYSLGNPITSLNDCPQYTREGDATPTPSGPLSVALAPDNPPGKTLTKNAVGVTYLKSRFSGTGTINSITLKREGPGVVGDFANVYIYKGAERLTSGKTFNSSDGTVTFINIDEAVNGTLDLSVVADMSGTAGNVNYISMTAVTASGTVTGLPISGNNMAISGTDSGTYDITKTGSLSNPVVGQKGVVVSQFKAAVNTEGGNIMRMTFLQGGSVKPGDLSGIKLKTLAGDKEWNGTINSDSYITVDLGSGYFIAKGGTKEFQLLLDIGGGARKDETIDVYFENNGDFLAIGDQYGGGMAEGTNGLDTAAEATTLTLQGGDLTIAFNGPGAMNLGTDTSDSPLMKLAFSAAANIDIKKTEFTLCWDDAGDGTYDAAADTTNGWADINDFKMTDDATGQGVISAADGSAFLTSDSGTCEDGVTGAQKTFTDTFEILAGQTRDFTVTADIKTANSGSGIALTTGDIIRVYLDNYGDDMGTSGDVTVMKYSPGNQAVPNTSLVPNADIAGSEMTVQATSLTLGLSASPGDQSYVKGTKNVDMVGITFAAAQASALNVTNIKLTGYAKDEDGDTFQEGTDDTDTGVSIANATTNYRLYESESGSQILATVTNNQLGTEDTGTIEFVNMNWNIPAGATRTLLVRVDLTNNAASGSNGDQYAFDVNATTDVTAVDDAGNTVNAANADPNGATSATTVLTVLNNGSITITAPGVPASPRKGGVFWGQIKAPISTFRLAATNEGQYIEKFTVAASVAAEIVDARANVKAVTVEYTNKEGTLLTSTAPFTNGASANFAFNGTARPYIPKDSSADIKVFANMKTKGDGGTTQEGANSVFFSLDFMDTFNGSTANSFRAVGDGSGSVIDGNTSGIADVTGANDQYVFRAFPRFVQINETGTEGSKVAAGNPVGEREVMRFRVYAMGLSDSRVLFDGGVGVDATSGSIKFEVVASGQASTNLTSDLVDLSTGAVVDSETITSAQALSPNASASYDFTSQDVEIVGGQSRDLSIRVNFQNFNDTNDYFSLILRDDENALINWIGNSTPATSDEDTSSITGVLTALPMSGPIFSKQ